MASDIGNIIILDQNMIPLYVLDQYTSFIWTLRYYTPGDFEIKAAVTPELVQYVKRWNFMFWSKSPKHIMVIDRVEYDVDEDDVPYVQWGGQDLKSLLRRRVVFPLTTVAGNVDVCVKKLITTHMISATDTRRNIGNLVYQDSTDPLITGQTVTTAQFTGDKMTDAVLSIIQPRGIGYDIQWESPCFVFMLYCGSDRSYRQNINSWIEFSPQFETLQRTKYYEDSSNFSNLAIIAGEDLGYGRRNTEFGSEEQFGIGRFELFVDARDLQSEKEDGTEMTENEYMEALRIRGQTKLADTAIDTLFDGEADPMSSQYKYGEDYFLGDIVTVKNEFGVSSNMRVVEYIRSISVSDGYKAYPTFAELEDGV